MPLFRKTTEITTLLDRFSKGTRTIDAAEFVQLTKLIQEQGDAGIQETGKTLKNLLKNGDKETQAKTIDLIRLVIDNGDNNNQRILDEDLGLSSQILKVANKGESRPRAKAREFLNTREENPRLAPLSSQVSHSTEPEDDSKLVREAEQTDLSNYRHDYKDLTTEPGNLENLLPNHGQTHYNRIEPEDIDTVPKIEEVSASLLDQLNQASSDNKVSPVLVENGVTVRDRLVNLFHHESANNGGIPDSLFKLNDKLEQAINHASEYVE